MSGHGKSGTTSPSVGGTSRRGHNEIEQRRVVEFCITASSSHHAAIASSASRHSLCTITDSERRRRGAMIYDMLSASVYMVHCTQICNAPLYINDSDLISLRVYASSFLHHLVG